MFNFFSSILEFFTMVWNFVSNFFSGMINAFSVIISAIGVPVMLSGYVPAVLSASVMIVGSLGIIKLILGWGNS